MDTTQAISAIIAAFAAGFGIGFAVGRRDKQAPQPLKDTDFCPVSVTHFGDNNSGQWIFRTIMDNGITKSVDCEVLNKKRCALTGHKCRFF